jgi:DNA-binding CsgD family transcriptional regulator
VQAAQVADVVSEIYGAVGKPDHWQALLARIAALLDCPHAALSYGGVQGIGVTAFSGFSPDAIDLYDAHYGAIHPLNQPYLEALGRGALPSVWTVETFAPLSAWRRSEFHDDWLLPNDVFHMCAATCVERDPLGIGTVHSLVVMRSKRGPAVSQLELDTMAALQPHVAAALEVERRLAPALVASALTMDLLEVLPPVLLCSGAGVTFANRRARSLLRQRTPLRVDKGELCASTPAATAALRSALARATGRTTVDSPPGATTVDVPVDHERHVRLLVAPAPRVAGPALETIVFLPDDGATNDLDATLRRVWRLTRGEADIAAQLWAGQEPHEIADARGSSVATVRTQIKTLLAKAGARGQIDFMRHVSRLLAPDDALSRCNAAA